jgi:hypothetical protein
MEALGLVPKGTGGFTIEELIERDTPNADPTRTKSGGFSSLGLQQVLQQHAAKFPNDPPPAGIRDLTPEEQFALVQDARNNAGPTDIPNGLVLPPKDPNAVFDPNSVPVSVHTGVNAINPVTGKPFDSQQININLPSPDGGPIIDEDRVNPNILPSEANPSVSPGAAPTDPVTSFITPQPTPSGQANLTPNPITGTPGTVGADATTPQTGGGTGGLFDLADPNDPFSISNTAQDVVNLPGVKAFIQGDAGIANINRELMGTIDIPEHGIFGLPDPQASASTFLQLNAQDQEDILELYALAGFSKADFWARVFNATPGFRGTVQGDSQTVQGF